ncbi:MAG: AraC family transcriptional regulator [Tetragenococcus koreensis]|uniref:AraC family transcriptional regulator n=1 Tax=Tetragenococcus halophilus TaxID=51669 RepID=UPI001F459185|nr:AraC family transcriptional regulator [Tetragenococcus halophilus]MCF1675816.1 AraC family transcriptional regulator [Tetragenococcus halophilus]MDN6167219.1 AraC family transcriptional regulator [Tetragenococcus koreensis]
MSIYLEIPQLDQHFPYRLLLNDGMTIVFPHWHKEIEIIYAKTGRVNIGLDGEVITLEEGEIIYFASGQPHYFLASPESVRYVYQFDLKLFDEQILRKCESNSLFTLFEEGQRHSRYWPEAFTETMRKLLLELFELENTETQGENYLILSLLYRLVGECYRFLPKQRTAKNKKVPNTIQQKETLQRLNNVFDYIENHYQEVIAINDIAHYVGFSPYYFTRFFKANTGQTFMQFLTEYRVNQAQFILGNEKLPMAEVAEKAGFASVKTFHHVFKESVGHSPLQYQKMMNQLSS